MFIDKIDKEKMVRCALLPKYPEEYLTNLLNSLKPKRILEIGTWNGITSAFFASFPFVESVYTIDIKKYVEGDLWGKLGVKNKIKYLLVKDNEEKKETINKLDFDFVFIDGDHSFKGVKLDFELVKDKCNYILFHDYGTNPYVTRFVDGLSNIKQKRTDMSFAWWKK